MSLRRCDDVMEQAYLYLDDEITWYRRTRIRRHLKRCTGCLSTIEFETHFKRVIREKGFEEPDPELIQRLRAFLHEHEHGSDESRA